MGGNPIRFVPFARRGDLKIEGEAREGENEDQERGEEGEHYVSFTYILADNF